MKNKSVFKINHLAELSKNIYSTLGKFCIPALTALACATPNLHANNGAYNFNSSKAHHIFELKQDENDIPILNQLIDFFMLPSISFINQLISSLLDKTAEVTLYSDISEDQLNQAKNALNDINELFDKVVKELHKTGVYHKEFENALSCAKNGLNSLYAEMEKNFYLNQMSDVVLSRTGTEGNNFVFTSGMSFDEFKKALRG